MARLAKHVELSLASVDLTLSQYRLLTSLAEGEAGSSRLAERMAISPPTVTSVVDGLVARGLVERRPDRADRRRQRLVLTEAGERAVAQADAAVEARFHGLLDRLGPGRAAAAVAALADWRDALDLHLEAHLDAGVAARSTRRDPSPSAPRAAPRPSPASARS